MMAIDVNKSRRWGCQIGPMIESRESCWHFALDSIQYGCDTVVKITRLPWELSKCAHTISHQWPYGQIQSRLAKFFGLFLSRGFFHSPDSALMAPPSLDKNPGNRRVAWGKTVKIVRARGVAPGGRSNDPWLQSFLLSASTPRRSSVKVVVDDDSPAEAASLFFTSARQLQCIREIRWQRPLIASKASYFRANATRTHFPIFGLLRRKNDGRE